MGEEHEQFAIHNGTAAAAAAADDNRPSNVWSCDA